MLNEIFEEAESRMKKSVTSVENEFVRIRTGRANTSLLDHIMVEYYGSPTQLAQCASVSVADSRTLQVQAWEKNLTPKIEKAIMESDLGLNPVTAGEIIRVPLPAMTEERRVELTKVVRQEGENGKVAIRNIRRDAISQAKDLEAEKEISEDDNKRAQDQIQTLTDKYTALVDKAVEAKVAEVMEV